MTRWTMMRRGRRRQEPQPWGLVLALQVQGRVRSQRRRERRGPRVVGRITDSHRVAVSRESPGGVRTGQYTCEGGVEE